MNNKSNVLRKLTLKINQIKKKGGIALEENNIITCKRFYDMDRNAAMKFLNDVITDLTNMRNQFKSEGKIVFYSDLYIEMFKVIGLTVRRMDLTYNLANTAFLEN